MLGLGNSLSTASAIDTYVNLKSVVFDGTGDYLDLGNPFQSTMQGSFSVAFWMKPDDGQPSANQVLLGSDNSADEDAFFVTLDTAGKIKIDHEADNDDASYITDAAVYANGAGAYKHIVVTVTKNTSGNTSYIIYVDGSAVAGSLTNAVSDTNHANFTSDINFYAGGLNDNGSLVSAYTGKIDELALWSTALTSGNVTATYNGGVTLDLNGIEKSNLVAYYRMFDVISSDADEVTVGTEKGIMHDAANPGLAANIWDSTPSTGHLTGTGTNTAAIEDGAYKVTYGNTSNGFTLKINDSVTGTTSEDLVVGAWYKTVTEWKLEGGSGTITPRIYSGASYTSFSPIVVTDGSGFQTKVIYFKVKNATAANFSIASNLGTGETAYLKVTSVQKLNGYPAITAADATSSTDVP